MTRYFTKSAYFDDATGETVLQPESVTVVDDGGLIETGLLDAGGRPIYRTDRIPMGFAPRPRVRVPAGLRRC